MGWFRFLRGDNSNVSSLSASRGTYQARPQWLRTLQARKRLEVEENDLRVRGTTRGLAPKAALYYKVPKGPGLTQASTDIKAGLWAGCSEQQRPSESSRCVLRGNQPFRIRSQTVTAGPGHRVQAPGTSTGKIHSLFSVGFLYKVDWQSGPAVQMGPMWEGEEV